MKPARLQVTQAQLDEYLREKRPEGGTYNIWHHRYSGLERDFNKQSTRPKFKVNIARDAGETVGSRNPNAYFCLFFAKGMCCKGSRCHMWHRVPTTEDHVETTIDCFGRDKFTEFRQDMGGIGGFIRENKTLYIGRIAITDDVDEVIKRHFGQFGPLDRVRILKSRGVAFVTYKTRANAEFAREAMMNQDLDNNEIINVRWATLDPKAQEWEDEEEERLEEHKFEQELAVMDSEEGGRQEAEADLPAEFTSLKRDVDEDGFNEMEERIKRRRQEEEDEAQELAANQEIAQREYEEYYKQYYEQQQKYYEQQQKQIEQENKKVAGIIPQKVLTNLKTLSKNTDLTIKNKNTNGLGGLADYASDSEEE
ncbi:uncharacterized protein B0P05DRAFT_528299 [Gilbertella persicaria]|nr:uncharacterized protein B0P05DRAFT_528299 [Gilbertella persicaria]KAI8090992.1 hypothetical protein B0P05DRAFT_528299 [Gilbertella persicaria]